MNEMLTINEYQVHSVYRAADKTLNINNITNYALGLVGEFGEVADIIKKIVGQGHSLDASLIKLENEIGDVIWYIACFAHINGSFMSEVVGGQRFEYFKQDHSLGEKNIYRMAQVIFRVSKHITAIHEHVDNLIETQNLVDYDKAFVNSHLSDLFAAVVALAHLLELNLETIARKNVDKLAARFPNGYEAQRSINRAE